MHRHILSDDTKQDTQRSLCKCMVGRQFVLSTFYRGYLNASFVICPVLTFNKTMFAPATIHIKGHLDSAGPRWRKIQNGKKR